MKWTEWVTLGLALLGAVLGVINTATGYRRGVRRIDIQCGFEKEPRTGRPGLWCRLINPGNVPVSVAAVRVITVRKDEAKEMSVHGSADVEAAMLGELPPGTSVLRFASADYLPYFGFVRDMYVKTQCGKLARVNRRMLRNAQNKLRAALGPTDKASQS